LLWSRLVMDSLLDRQNKTSPLEVPVTYPETS